MVSKVLLVAAPIVANGLQIAQHRSDAAMTTYDDPDVEQVSYNKNGVAVDAVMTMKVKIYEAYDWGTTYNMVLVDDCSKSTVRKCAGQSNGCDAAQSNGTPMTYGYCGSDSATLDGKEVEILVYNPKSKSNDTRTGFYTAMCTDGTGQNGKEPSEACLGNSEHPNVAGDSSRKLRWCMTKGDAQNDFTTKAVPYKTQSCADGQYGKCGETTCVGAFVRYVEKKREEPKNAWHLKIVDATLKECKEECSRNHKCVGFARYASDPLNSDAPCYLKRGDMASTLTKNTKWNTYSKDV